MRCESWTGWVVVACWLASGCSDGVPARDGAEVTPTLAVSGSHFCAVRQAGLFCWGDNFAGELGTGTLDPSELPVQVTAAGDDVVEVVASTGRTCVRRGTGELACWGLNGQGQLGDGTRTDSPTPIAVVGIDDARQLAIDDDSTCALRADATVACWGRAQESRPEEGALTPEPIAGLHDVAEVRGGVIGAYCARSEAGSVRCWGFEEGPWQAPTEVPALEGARGIAVSGSNVVCAVMQSGPILCHNLANGVTSPLSDSEGAEEIVGTALVACALNANEGWQCWNVLPPMLETVGSLKLAVPESDSPYVELAVGGFNVCALREDNQVACANAADTPVTARIVERLPD